jgi:hypothetical protein
MIGFLIMHGFLYGYDENNNEYGMTRGRRIFCSNRNKRTGCGRTINLFKSIIIKAFTITASTISRFLNNIAKGLNISVAFRLLNLKAGKSTPYRLFERFRSRQPEIRTTLSKITKQPENLSYDDPVLQTIEHINNAFNNCECTVSAFQYTSQTSFF